MSFSKAVFLSSLTYFTFGVGSCFAGCTGSTGCTNIVNCNDDPCKGECDGECNTRQYSSYYQAIEYINAGNEGPITFSIPNTDEISSNPPPFTESTNIVSNYPGGTVLSSNAQVSYINVDAPDIVVTLGPSSSEPLSFDMSSSNIRTLQGTLVLGPLVEYPSSANLGSIWSESPGGTIELQKTGTIGCLLQTDPGSLYISTNPVDKTLAEVTFTDQLYFSKTSTLRGDSGASKCISTITNPVNFQYDYLILQSITLQINSSNGNTGQANTLDMQGSATLEAARTLTLNSTIKLSNGGNTLSTLEDQTFTLSGNISGTGDLTLAGAGTIILTNTNNSFENLALDGGTLSVSDSRQINGSATTNIYLNPDTTLSITESMSFNLTFNVATSDTSTNPSNITLASGITLTITNQLNGNDASLLKVSSVDTTGELTLTGSLDGYLGQITLDNTDFNMNGTSAVNSIASFDLTNNSGLNLGVSMTTGGISGDATSVIGLDANNLSMVLAEDNIFSGSITGTGGVTYSGPYTMTLGGTSTYTGTTTLGNGIILSISADSNLGSLGDLTFGGSGTLNITEDLTLNRDLTLTFGSIAVIDLEEGVNATFSGVISGEGALYVQSTSNDPGSLTLSATNTFTGGTTLENAILKIDSSGNLGVPQKVTFKSGTLKAIDSLDISGFLIMDSGGGTLSVESPNTLTLSGVISGSDTVTLAGSGIVIVSGSNTYTGNTILEATELRVSSDSNLGDSSSALVFSGDTIPQLTVTGDLTTTRDLSFQSAGAIFDVGTGLTASFTGDVLATDSSFSLTKKGSGALSILPSAVNTDPDIHLVINEGGIVTSTLVLQSGSAELLSGTTLTFSQEGNGSYNGDSSGNTISGTGEVIIDGTGTLSMLVPTSRNQLTNTYTGGTTLTSGTLAINIDGALGVTGGITGSGGTLQTVLGFNESSNTIELTRAVSLSSDTSTTFNTDKSTVLALALGISGSGNLIKDGLGVLIIADSTYTGTTTVNDGILVLNGSVTGNLTVEPPGILKGIGSGTNIVIHGGITPGSSGEIFTVLEDLAFESGSTLFQEISTLESSLIDVIGTVTINPGSNLIVVPDQGSYTDVLVLTALESDGGITGEFTREFAPVITYMKVDANYTANSVEVEITPLTITLTGAGNNANAVANTLNDVIAWNRSNVDFSIPGLDVLGVGKLEAVLESLLPIHGTSAMNDALDQMHSAPLKGVVVAQENASVQVQESLSTHLNEEMETLDCARTKRAYTFWINGMGSATSQDNNTYKGSPQAGYNNTMAGFIAGADYRFIDLLYAGVLGGYTSSHVNFQKNRGSGDVHTGYLGLYLSAIGEGFFANVSVTGGWNGYSANRHIEYTGVNVTAKNSHGGRQLMSHLEGGLNLPIGRFNIRPFDRFDYLSQQEYGYKEKDAGDWNLSVNKNTSILLRNELGLQFASCFQVKTGKITISPKLSWVRETRTRGSKYTEAFTDAEDFTFSVTGYFPNRSLLSTGGVITGALLEDKLSLSAYYDGEFTSGYSAHRYGGEVRVSF